MDVAVVWLTMMVFFVVAASKKQARRETALVVVQSRDGTELVTFECDTTYTLFHLRTVLLPLADR